jgi:hypothetical protein
MKAHISHYNFAAKIVPSWVQALATLLTIRFAHSARAPRSHARPISQKAQQVADEQLRSLFGQMVTASERHPLSSALDMGKSERHARLLIGARTRSKSFPNVAAGQLDAWRR